MMPMDANRNPVNCALCKPWRITAIRSMHSTRFSSSRYRSHLALDGSATPVRRVSSNQNAEMSITATVCCTGRILPPLVDPAIGQYALVFFRFTEQRYPQSLAAALTVATVVHPAADNFH
jgi:hypothetical protein